MKHIAGDLIVNPCPDWMCADQKLACQVMPPLTNIDQGTKTHRPYLIDPFLIGLGGTRMNRKTFYEVYCRWSNCESMSGLDVCRSEASRVKSCHHWQIFWDMQWTERKGSGSSLPVRAQGRRRQDATFTSAGTVPPPSAAAGMPRSAFTNCVL